AGGKILFSWRSLPNRPRHIPCILSSRLLNWSPTMTHQLPLPAKARADHPPEGHHALGLHELTSDLAFQRLALVNVAFIGPARPSDWILVDAGIPGMPGLILRAARARYGNAPPAA